GLLRCIETPNTVLSARHMALHRGRRFTESEGTMATATATKRPVASPKANEEAKAKAIQLCAEAYAPQPIPQPDGSTLMLCWEGRVNRAWAVWQQVKASGDNDKAQKIEEMAVALGHKMDAARAAAEKAASDYGTLVSSVGWRVEDVYPPQCQCEQCQRMVAQQEYFAAEMELYQAVSVLIEPAHERNMPALVALIDGAGDEKNRDLLWRTLKRIADAQKRYAAACKAYDQTPQWRRAMYGGD